MHGEYEAGELDGVVKVKVKEEQEEEEETDLSQATTVQLFSPKKEEGHDDGDVVNLQSRHKECDACIQVDEEEEAKQAEEEKYEYRGEVLHGGSVAQSKWR